MCRRRRNELALQVWPFVVVFLSVLLFLGCFASFCLKCWEFGDVATPTFLGREASNLRTILCPAGAGFTVTTLVFLGSSLGAI